MTAHRKPIETFNALVSAGIEVIRLRDPVLGATLDVPPPSVDYHAPEPDPPPGPPPLLPGWRGRVQWALRRIAGILLRIGPLRPLLRLVRPLLVRLLAWRPPEPQE